MTKTDREQIEELMVRYGRAIDARDYVALSLCFTEDAVLRFVSFARDLQGRDELVGWIKPSVEALDGTHHLFLNFLVETVGDSGRFTCSVIAQHLKDGAILTIGGDYKIEVVRKGDAWYMSAFHFAPVWSQGNRDLVPHAPS